MTMVELTINPVFKDLLDLPSETERKELERQLLRDKGPRDPIVVWKEKNTIVDGHNRYAICKAHNLHFITDMRSFKDEAAVEEWILENQLARRNLSPARSSYFLGLLYNKYKQVDKTPTKDGKTTAEKLAEKFGVNEKTVRRAGSEAKGVDIVAKVKGVALDSVSAKLAAIKDKNTGVFTKGELEELGKAKEEVAEIAAKIMVDEKTAIADALKRVKGNKVQATKAAPAKAPTKAPAKAKPIPYNVVLSEPQFDRAGWSPALEDRPLMSEHSICYMIVPDEELVKGIDLLKKWGLSYEGSYILKVERYEGVWADIHHQFLLIGTKGTPMAPKKLGKSLLEGDMVKMIESYHNGSRKLDMRKEPAQGWDKK